MHLSENGDKAGSRYDFFNTLYRALSGFVLIPFVLALAWLGGVWFLLLIGVFTLLGNVEFYQMMRQGGYRPLWIVSIPLTLGLIGLAYLGVPLQWDTILITVATFLTLGLLTLRKDPRSALPDWALTIAGALYLGLPMSCFVRLRALPDGSVYAATRGILPDGLAWLAAGVLVVWASDTWAYLLGYRAFGRRGFFRWISPKKTVEGAISGLVAGGITGTVAFTLLGQPPLHGLFLGILITVTGIFGDLAESLLKRHVGVKDSGKLIPGHGGVLDRLDSLLFAVVTLYYYVTLVLRPS